MSDISSDSDEYTFIPEEISVDCEISDNGDNLLPEKSKLIYEKAYSQFMEWKCKNNVVSFSESVFIGYFDELSKEKKPSSLWSHYSMIKSTIKIKHDVDISKYSNLIALLKRKSKGYSGKKAKIFSSDQIKTFLDQAPDEIHLLTKVSMIIGIFGACRRQELHRLKFDDVKDIGSHVIVILQNTRTKKPRTFTITGKYLATVQKYMKLRPNNVQTKLFFLNYKNGKCTSVNVGINKVGAMGKTVAAYLNLPNPELYTGHCFRRSSTTLLVDGVGDILALKRHGGWKSTTEAENYVDTKAENYVDTKAENYVDTKAENYVDTEAENYVDTEAENYVDTEAENHVDEPIQNTVQVSNQILECVDTRSIDRRVELASTSTSKHVPHVVFNNCVIYNLIVPEKE